MANNKFLKTFDGEPKEPKQQTCQAAGCPMFGTRSPTSGSDKWWCRYHFGQELSEFGKITDRIIQVRPMIEHLKRLKKAHAGLIADELPHLFFYERNTEFSRREGESYGQYCQRLELALKYAILSGVERPKMQEAKGLVESKVETLTEQFTGEPA